MFICRLCYKTLLLQGINLVLETDSGSESSDFIEEDTEESSTEVLIMTQIQILILKFWL